MTLEFAEQLIFQRFPYPRRGTFVDVGANVGYVCNPLIADGWSAVLFEPHPDLIKVLTDLHDDNAAVIVVPHAISDAPGEMPFYTSDEHPGIHSLAAFHPTHKPTTTVKVTTLRVDLQRLGVEEVTALKIDVEGADLLALRGFDFQTYRPSLVMVEFMDDRSQEHFGYTHHDMVALMRANGYEAFVSEWHPITEYGRVGERATHRWKRFRRYTPQGHPAWGNLLFVQPQDAWKLRRAVARVLIEQNVRPLVRRIPGLRPAFRLLKRLRGQGEPAAP
jgi:FkbM family methyltransferase